MNEQEKREQAARNLVHALGADDYEVDRDAETSTGEDGIWVQTWILISHADIDEEVARNGGMDYGQTG